MRRRGEDVFGVVVVVLVKVVVVAVVLVEVPLVFEDVGSFLTNRRNWSQYEIHA